MTPESSTPASSAGDALPEKEMLPPAPQDLVPDQRDVPRPPQDPGPHTVEPPETPDTPASETTAWGETLVTEPLMRELWRRADDLQKRINREVNYTRLAKTLLDQILEARNALRRGPDQYEEAERLLNEVAYRLDLQQRVRTWSRQIGYKLFFYEMAWAGALVALMLVAPIGLRRWAVEMGYSLDPEMGPDSVQWLILGLKSALWGGLGGVAGALYALWRHIAQKQDFDPQHTIWYLTSPPMGTVLGAFAFLAVQTGLFSLTGGADSRIHSAAMVFLLAWVSGFQQNVVYNIVRRILQTFRLDDQNDTDGFANLFRRTPKNPEDAAP